MGKIYNTEETTKTKNVSISDDLLISIVNGEKNKPILFRDELVSRIVTLFNKKEHRAILLVGNYGIGKNTIIKSLARQIKIFKMSFDALINDVNNVTDVRNRVNICINGMEMDDKNSVLYIDSFGKQLRQSCYGNAGYIFVDEIAKAVINRDIKFIATTTNTLYKKLEDEFPEIIDSFYVIRIEELTKEQSRDVVFSVKNEYEKFYGIHFSDDIIDLVCEKADKHIKSCCYPLKPLIVLDEMCARAAKTLGDRSSEHTNELYEQKRELEDKMSNSSLLDMSMSDLTNMIADLYELNTKIEKSEFKDIKNKINMSDDVMIDALSKVINVPINRLSKDKAQFLRNMPDELKKDIIGQDETIDKIVRNVRRNQIGLRKSAHSCGNFLFIGSTGVGKTATAKALAKYLYGSESNLIRFDMSEYQSEIDVSKLLGSAPGYVGYKESGLLVKRLSEKPESVVLFDEIEKAHPKIYDVLLQLMDEGIITGGDGKKVDGTKALIIMTSNIGVKQAQEFSSPIGFNNDNITEIKSKREKEIMDKALKKRFNPEFINRLDSVCYFNNLDKDMLCKITEKEINDMNCNIEKLINKRIVLSDKLKQWIVDNTYKQNQGARPIIRTIEQKIEEEISNLLIEEDNIILNSKQKELLADIDKNDNVHFSVKKKCKSIVDAEPVNEKDVTKEAESNYN